MNERTHFFIKIYLSHFILDFSCVWEVSWRRGQTATYLPKVLLTIAALFSHSGWAAQPWGIDGPSPLSGAVSHSTGILSPTETGTQQTQAICGTWLYFACSPPASCEPTHLPPSPNSTKSTDLRLDAPASLFFRLFTQVHLLIDGSGEGQYITNILIQKFN